MNIQMATYACFIVFSGALATTKAYEKTKQVVLQAKNRSTQEWFGVLKDGNIQKLKRILDHGVDINTKDVDGRTLLMRACQTDSNSSHNIKIVKFLLQQPGIAVNSKDKWGHTAFSYATAGYSDEILELLLKVPGIDSNTQDNEGQTPLMAAVTFTTPMRVKRLLAIPGINVHLKDKMGKTVLDKASAYAKNNPHDAQDQQVFQILKNFVRKV